LTTGTDLIFDSFNIKILIPVILNELIIFLIQTKINNSRIIFYLLKLFLYINFSKQKAHCDTALLIPLKCTFDFARISKAFI